MSQKKEKKDRKEASHPLKKALSSTLLAGTLLTSATQALGNEDSPRLTVSQRVERIREAVTNRLAEKPGNLDDLLSKASYEEAELLQWGNWGNWGNWANWNNWGNWANWNNWGNWYNWGNF
jgi:hypothetical protein